MNFMKAVSILVPRILATTMTHRFMFVSPFRQTTLNVVLISVYKRSWIDELLYDRLDRCLLHILQDS